jgi:DnaJ-like protein
MADPYSVLGVSEGASVAQMRAAFRRLALRHHPDRNPHDPLAGERFKTILWAYRAALRGPRGSRTSQVPPAGPRPDRFGCASCGDTFPFPGERCPRCAIQLYDRHSETPPSVGDPRVAAWESRMDGRPAWEDDSAGDGAPFPGLLAAAFVGMAGLSWSLGPIAPAILFGGFAAYIAAVEGRRLIPTSFAR